MDEQRENQPWDMSGDGKPNKSGWNIQKTIVVMLAVLMVMHAGLYVLIFSGRSCNPAQSVDNESELTQELLTVSEVTTPEISSESVTEKTTADRTTSSKENVTTKENATTKENPTTKDNSATKDGSTKDNLAGNDDTNENATVPQSGDNAQKPEAKPQNPETQPAAPAPQPTAPAAQTPATPSPAQTPKEGTYSAEVSVVNSWEENGKKCYQLSGTLKNTSSVDINTWKIEKDIGSGCTVSSFWNCNCTVNGSKLVITPADYNSVVSAGNSANDIGMIISSSTEIKNFSYSGTTTNVTASGGSSSGGSSGGSPAPSTPVTPYVPPVLESGTPVGNHGTLAVKGTDLVDKNGKKFQLKGVSTHGLQWFPQYVNKDAIKTLRDNWGANVFRLAMYPHEGGYSSGANKNDLETLVCKGVEACTELGMYVIIDWHVLNERNPNVYKEDAKVFFDRMSKKYKDNVNVIYEICNEPNGPGWAEIKQYADEIIPIIRKNDPDAIIIVGTPTWSQEVDQVAANPVAQPKNVMYALHFYAATHKDDLRNKLKRAHDAGTPVFISEFSICDASGNGGIDYTSAQAWKDLINQYNISFISWSLCNKAETSALIKSSCSKTSGWGDEDLSDTGTWIRNFIAGK